MNFNAKERIRKQLETYGEIEIDVVPHDGSKFYTEKFKHEGCYESIVFQIEVLEHDNEVYF
jgi:hypothetical protein